MRTLAWTMWLTLIAMDTLMYALFVAFAATYDGWLTKGICLVIALTRAASLRGTLFDLAQPWKIK